MFHNSHAGAISLGHSLNPSCKGTADTKLMPCSNHNKPSATNHTYAEVLKWLVEYQAQPPVMEKEVSLTAIKYSTQSAEQMVSKIKVIRPSSDPVAPVTDVGGLFNREGTKYLYSALQTGSSQSFKFLFVQWSHQSPVTENLSLQNGRSLCTGAAGSFLSV